jgi:hypothetical protein
MPSEEMTGSFASRNGQQSSAVMLSMTVKESTDEERQDIKFMGQSQLHAEINLLS